ncbi:hypothetical protein TW81_03810 [Vibrio galatheae]|uniref:histidine kinase n=1 Tax=Vibrio galatheae TaxID=579748 RepID=A0A0F4NP56_9VIBR|nr:transporter substrate-binding domain-containing protein [Vibrio galatheae]KJY84664.1 hypothetical protein TW81_03810 [Vibrio galatheae]
MTRKFQIRYIVFITLCLTFLSLNNVDNAYASNSRLNVSEHEKNSTLVFGTVTDTTNSDTSVDMGDAFFRINHDYLVNIGNVLDFEVSLKAYPTVSALLKGVELGEVVGAVGFSKTSARESKFIFSNPFFTSNVSVWYADKYMEEKGAKNLTWACVEGTSYCEQLTSFGISNIFYAKNLSQATESVLSGDSDAVISNFVVLNKFLDSQDIVKGTLSTPKWVKNEEVRLITTQRYAPLVDKINQVLDLESKGSNIRSIASDNLYHTVELKLNDYQAADEYHQSVTYSAAVDAYPFSYIGQNGQIEGFLKDFFQLLKSRTGLEFQHVKPNTNNNQLSSYNTDLVPVAYTEYEKIEKWQLTRPFLTINYVALSRDEDSTSANTKVDTIGLFTSSEHQGFVHLTGWRDSKIKQYETIKELLTDLKRGAVKFAYVPEDIAHTLVVRNDLGGLDMNGYEPLKINLALAVKNSPKLKTLLDSIFTTLDVNEMNKLMRSYRQINFIHGYDDKQVITIAAAVLILMLLGCALSYFIVSNLKLKVGLAEANANQEENEKEWLKNIISELDSWVFIHDSQNQMVLSNCAHFKNGDCSGCSVASRSARSPLVDNKQEVVRVLSGQTIADFHQVQDCRLSVSHIFRQRKAISSPRSSNRFVLTILNDITEHKTREAELTKAQESAQEAVVSRERFLATMSHELRTPIAAVQGLLELMHLRPLESEVLELIDQAKQSTRHLNKLVDEVLDFSKLHSDQLSINPVETDLLETVGTAIRSFEGAIRAKELDYIVDIAPFSQHHAVIDDVRLVQIINNLMSNAIKFTSSGFIKVEMSVSGQALSMTISDSGIGMTPEQIDKVLNPFTQADNGVTRQFGGTGLGLSIVDKLVTCMGGTLVLDSILNVGSVFRVQLPIEVSPFHGAAIENATYSENLPTWLAQWCRVWGLTPSNDNASLLMLDEQTLAIRTSKDNLYEMSAVQYRYPHLVHSALSKLGSSNRASEEVAVISVDKNHAGTPQTLPLRGKVLVAEDNLINQNIIAMQLSELGVEATIVDNGQQALNYLRSNTDFNALLTDFHMPIMDGFELTRHIRQDESLSSLPVIGLTAEDSRVAHDLASRSGLDKVLCKPYSMLDLYAVLSNYLTPAKFNTATPVVPGWLEPFTNEQRLEFSELFISTMSQDLNKLRASSDDNDQRQAIHYIKGGLAAVGLTSLVNDCQSIEKATPKTFPEKVQFLIEQLTKEIDAVKHWRAYQ